MGALYDVADSFDRFMASAPGFVMFLVGVVLAAPAAVLLHELGHALAARRLLGAEVRVTVGGAGKLAEVRMGQVVLAVNALSLPGRPAGTAEFDAGRATARDAAVIALAGPAASLLGAVLCAWALSGAGPTGFVHDLLWMATITGVFGVLNVIPLRVAERRHGPVVHTDGRVALDALRVIRLLRAST